MFGLRICRSEPLDKLGTGFSEFAEIFRWLGVIVHCGGFDHRDQENPKILNINRLSTSLSIPRGSQRR